MLDLTIELKEFEKTLKNIPKGKSILIAAHNDVDGITSAFVFSRILDKLGFEYNNHYRTWIVDNAFRQKINENKQTAKDINRFDYIFFLDYGLDNYNIIENKFVGVIDHHPIIGKPKIIINPTNTIPSKDVPSASALVYALYRHMFDDNETIRKIAFLGALGDLMLIKSLPYLGIDIDNSEYFLNQIPQTIFNHMFNIFNLTNIDPRNSKIIYEYMINNVNDSILPMILYPEEFEIQIQKLYKNQRKTLKSIINTAEHVEDKEIIFVQFKRKQNIYFDMLRVTLNAIYPTHTLFIFMELPDNLGYRVSGRSQTKCDLTKLIDYLKEKIPDLKGGGHPFAAGFYFKPQYYKQVKKEIINNIQNFPRD